MGIEQILCVPVILAAVGGFVVVLLSLIELQHVPKDRRPDFSDPFYWAPFFLFPFFGGVVGFLYNDGDTPLTKIVAFHLGLSSPLILRTMATVIPNQAQSNLPPGA